MSKPAISNRRRLLIQFGLFLAVVFLAVEQPTVSASHDLNITAAYPHSSGRPSQATQGASFEWVSLHDASGTSTLTVDRPENYVVHVQRDGTIGVRADCNWRAAEYDHSVGTLTLGPTLGNPTTCPGHSLSHRFIELLADTAAFEIQPDGSLSILHRSGGRLTFRPHQTPS